MDYRAAGVDIDAAEDAKERYRRLVESTRTAGAVGAFGSFGGLFRAPTGEPFVLFAAGHAVAEGRLAPHVESYGRLLEAVRDGRLALGRAAEAPTLSDDLDLLLDGADAEGRHA
jgi:hypothetical protein